MTKHNLDYTGQKFGRLTAVKDAGFSRHRHKHWEFLCDCGNRKIASMALVKFGNIRSCGCLQKEWGRKLGKSGLGNGSLPSPSEVRKLRSSGLSYEKIGKMFGGLSKQAVHQYLKHHDA